MRPLGRALAAAAAGLWLIAAAPIRLESNRATYKVSLDHALPGSVVAVDGRMVIEFRVTCTSYDSTQRFVSDMTDAEGTVSRSDFAVVASESRDGSALRFDVTNMVDGQIAERYKGQAVREADGSGSVTLGEPAGKGFALPAGAIFPTMQTLDVIAAAQAGRRYVTRTVFQGGGQDDLYYSTTTIGAPASAEVTAREAAAAGPLLAGVAAWPVLMSYYALGDNGEAPQYEISARLYANGVIGSMALIYNRFTLRAELEKVEKLATPPC